jgi:hypothetical protein
MGVNMDTTNKNIVIILLCTTIIILMQIAGSVSKFENKDINVNNIMPETKNTDKQEDIPLVSDDIKTFKIGSSSNELKKVMGKPTDILKGSNSKEIWYYGDAKVFLQFDKVYDYDNDNEILKIEEEEEEERKD